jgi:hypothetical protein
MVLVVVGTDERLSLAMFLDQSFASVTMMTRSPPAVVLRRLRFHSEVPVPLKNGMQKQNQHY